MSSTQELDENRVDMPDMVNRDPNNMNFHARTLFEDVIGEPDGAHSADCVWKNSYGCFTGGKNCCYTVLTYVCALPLALCWGCTFACVTFAHIWQVGPCYRVVQINMSCAQKFFGTCVHCVCDPCYESMSLLLSNIRVLSGNSTELNQYQAGGGVSKELANLPEKSDHIA
ncbi:unnamed protein product [Owenia fusiformis]|uniref:Caveolin n=1 Tax=Owenia fusiformis TaxID=6347 RepID=A0A8J1XGT7_OWEFU|nr:unnamed protein product [Owenia fusiformis]